MGSCSYSPIVWGGDGVLPYALDLKKFEKVVRVSEGVGGPQCGIFTTQAIRHTVFLYMPLKCATRPHSRPSPEPLANP